MQSLILFHFNLNSENDNCFNFRYNLTSTMGETRKQAQLQNEAWRGKSGVPLEVYSLHTWPGVLPPAITQGSPQPKIANRHRPRIWSNCGFRELTFFLLYQVNELGHIVKMFAFSLPMRKMLVLKIFSLIICMSKSFFCIQLFADRSFFMYILGNFEKKNYSRITYTDPITSKVY